MVGRERLGTPAAAAAVSATADDWCVPGRNYRRGPIAPTARRKRGVPAIWDRRVPNLDFLLEPRAEPKRAQKLFAEPGLSTRRVRTHGPHHERLLRRLYARKRLPRWCGGPRGGRASSGPFRRGPSAGRTVPRLGEHPRSQQPSPSSGRLPRSFRWKCYGLLQLKRAALDDDVLKIPRRSRKAR